MFVGCKVYIINNNLIFFLKFIGTFLFFMVYFYISPCGGQTVLIEEENAILIKNTKSWATMSCGCGCCGEVVAYEDWEETDVIAAEYQGRSVTLNKPCRTKGESKKFGVYTKNEKGNVIKLGFGDPNMEIKRDDPARRKSFRARHNCDDPGPKWKARYWSCYQWRAGAKVDEAQGPCWDGYEQRGMKKKGGKRGTVGSHADQAATTIALADRDAADTRFGAGKTPHRSIERSPAHGD